VFLGQEIDDQIANVIITQLLYLEAQDPDKDIALYVNSPGGMAYAGMAIYDVIQHIRPEVATTCVGMGMSAAAMILCSGARGKRYALPNSRIMTHQGSAGTRGAPSDMEVQLREVLATTRRMAEIIAHHCDQPVEKVERDIDRDYFMSAEDALSYGMIDEIMTARPQRALGAPSSGLVATVRWQSEMEIPLKDTRGWQNVVRLGAGTCWLDIRRLSEAMIGDDLAGALHERPEPGPRRCGWGSGE
jgi:ATP-dependent Clp protease protease subunit